MRLLATFLAFAFMITCAKAEGGDEDGADSSSEETGTQSSKKKLDIPIIFYELKPIIVPVIKGDKVIAYVRVVIQLATKDQTSIDGYRIYKKRLRDLFFTDLYETLCDRWLPGTEPNQNSVLKRLQACTDKIVGPDKLVTIIKGFYFYKPDKEAPPPPQTKDSEPGADDDEA